MQNSSATPDSSIDSVSSNTTGTFMTSSTSLDGRIEQLLSSFRKHTEIAAAIATATTTTSTNEANLFCNDAAFVGCVLPTGFPLEKLVTATEVDISEVINISIFPHINVRGVDVVKVNLLEDVCKPLPKPGGGGLFGAVLKVASNVVKGIIDAACNVEEFPVVKSGKVPKWFNFGRLPTLNKFPTRTRWRT
jgi:hypothetical protein